MFPITITINSNEDLDKVLAVLRGEEQTRKPTEVKAPEVKEEKKDPKPAAAEEAAPSSGTTSASEESSAPSGTGELKGYTMDDAKALTRKVVADKSHDAAVALLAKFDVKVAAKLLPEQITPFCLAAEKELGA